MKAHLKGEFLAVIEVDDDWCKDLPYDEEVYHRVFKEYQQKAIMKLDEALAKLRHDTRPGPGEEGVVIATMTEYVDGAPVGS